MPDPIIKSEEKKPHWVQQFIDRAKGTIAQAPPASATSYVRETVSTAGEYTGGAVVGSLLGAAHAKWGLDTKGGPIDGWLAGLGGLLSVGLSGHLPQVAAYARKVGTNAVTVFTFRKSYETVKHEPLLGGVANGVQRIAAPGKGPGVHGEDPIVRLAQELG
jgi:hypothetical protein